MPIGATPPRALAFRIAAVTAAADPSAPGRPAAEPLARRAEIDRAVVAAADEDVRVAFCDRSSLLDGYPRRATGYYPWPYLLGLRWQNACTKESSKKLTGSAGLCRILL